LTFRLVRTLAQYGGGQARDAHQVVLGIDNTDVPHHRRAPDVQRTRRADHVRRTAGAHMVGVDFQAHDVVVGWAAHDGGDTADRFCQYHGSTAVDDAHVLSRALVDRQACGDVIVT